MPTFDYRRRLTLKEQLPAVGAAVGAAAAVFYLARLLLQRTPLLARPETAPEPDPASLPRPAVPARRRARG